MSQLPDAAQFQNITLPGSHDAGVFLSSNPGYTKAQDRDLMAQLYAGSRFFDLRAYKGKRGQMRFGHYFEPIKATRGRTVGGINKHAMGGSLDVEIGNVRLFLEANPTETVILRFSHIAHSAPVVSAVRNQLGPRLYMGGRPGNLATWDLGPAGNPNSLRGHAIACFDTKEFMTNAAMGLVPFQKYKPGDPAHLGLVTCGEYAAQKGLGTVIVNQQEHLAAHQNHPPNDHLLCVYWQQTGGNIEANTRAGAHAQLSNFLGNISGAANRAHVVLHDFVNPETCGAIIEGMNAGVVV